MIHIGIDARQLTQPKTGIGNYVFNLVKALTQVDRTNQYTLFITELDSLKPLTLPANFQTVLVPAYSWDKLQDQLGLHQAMRDLKLDIFHTTHHDVTPLLSSIPIITTVHDLAPMDFPNPSLPHRLYYRLFSWLAFKRARHLVCVSNSTGQRLEHHFPFCRRKWSTVYEGRDLYYQPLPEPERFNALQQQWGLGTSFLLYVGSFARRKNLVNMFHAFTLVKKLHPQLQFVIVGGPSGRDDDLPPTIPPDVLLVGRVGENDLRVLYNHAELLLFISRYEGFGIPVIEALSCGCPVITSRLTSLPELGGEAVLYADPDLRTEIAQQIERILTDTHFQQELRAKSLQQALQFDWQQAAITMKTLYETTAPS